ncbi:hypothetical protein PG994_008686, partial [Apiospora phragmitis]
MVLVYSDSGLCDGVPVNYTSSPTSDSTGNLKRLCTTQSPDGTSPIWTASTLPLRRWTLLLLLLLLLKPSNSTRTRPISSYLPSTPLLLLPRLFKRTRRSTRPRPLIPLLACWPRPPARPGWTTKSIPTRARPPTPVVPRMSLPSPLGPSDTSPRSWSSPDLQQLHYPPGYYQISNKGQQQQDFPPYGGGHHHHHHHQPAIATAEESFSTQPMDYSVSDSDVKNDPGMTMGQEAPGMTPDHTESAMSVDSPLSRHGYSSAYPYEDGGVGDEMPHPHQPEPEPEEDKPGDVPYAKTIEKAFRTKASYSMTLQELYQWFRENTYRGRATNKGWQNSIRHNLSMNKVRIRKARKKAFSRGRDDRVRELKRSNEWVLADWAIRDGVQSTTRYRKANSTSRRGASSRAQQPQGVVSARAASGRKGGLTASKTKAAHNRALLRQQSMGILPQHHHFHATGAGGSGGGGGSSSSYHHQQQPRHHSTAFYHQPQRLHIHTDYNMHDGRHHLPMEADYTRLIPHHHDEPESSEGGSLLQYTGQHPLTSMASIGSGSGYYHPQPYLASQASQQQQQPYPHETYSSHHHHHQHQQPPLPPQPHYARPEPSHFKVEHATSVYEPPVTSSPSSAAIHGVYASVFTNEMGRARQKT